MAAVAAKCSSAVSGTSGGQCLRTVYLGPGIAAIYAFPEAALMHWREFDPMLGERLKQIGALSAPRFSYWISSRSTSRIAIWKL